MPVGYLVIPLFFRQSATLTLTGASLTLSAGSAVANVAPTTTGAQATFSGSTVANVAPTKTGAQATFSAGSTVTNVAPTKTGAQATFSAGAPYINVQVIETSVQANAGAGSTVANVAPTTSVQATFSAGAPYINVQVVETGASASLSARSPVSNVKAVFSGAALSSGAGTLIANVGAVLGAGASLGTNTSYTPLVTMATLDPEKLNGGLSANKLQLFIATDQGGTGDGGALSTHSTTTKKIYFEAVTNDFNEDGFDIYTAVGVAKNLTYVFLDHPGYIQHGGAPISESIACFLSSDGDTAGKFFCQGPDDQIDVTPLFGKTPGVVIGVAFDPNAQKIWFRLNNGAWNPSVAGTQDPATGQGGIRVPFSGSYKAILNGSSVDGRSIYAHFDPLVFSYAAPSGFYPLGDDAISVSFAPLTTSASLASGSFVPEVKKTTPSALLSANSGLFYINVSSSSSAALTSGAGAPYINGAIVETGAAFSAQAKTLAVAETVFEIGVAASLLVGTVSPEASVTISAALAASSGQFYAAISGFLAGAEIVSDAFELQIQGAIRSGVANTSASVLRETVVPSFSGAGMSTSAATSSRVEPSILGVPLSSAASEPRIDETVILSGSALASAASLSTSVQPTFSGAQVAASTSDMRTPVDVVLPATTLTSSAGSLYDTVTKTLSGAGVTANTRDLLVSIAHTVSIVGAGFFIGTGALATRTTIAPSFSGVSASFAPGSVTTPRTQLISGTGLTVSTGALRHQVTRAISGTGLTISVGSVRGLPSAQPLSALITSGAQAILRHDIVFSMSGAAISIQASVQPDVHPVYSSVSMTTGAGLIVRLDDEFRGLTGAGMIVLAGVPRVEAFDARVAIHALVRSWCDYADTSILIPGGKFTVTSPFSDIGVGVR